MIEEGLFERFPCDGVFALHNLPGQPLGQITVRPGAITACVDIVNVVIRGVGGHGALPHLAVDPIVAASGVVLALQSIVARNLDPLDPAVVTVGAFNAGSMATAIPAEAHLQIGVRTCTEEVRAFMKRRITDIIQGQAKSFGCEAEIQYGHGYSYPPGYNAPELAAAVRAVALDLGQKPADVDIRGPYMFSEDFAYMQQAVPGCFFGIGNGDSRGLHDSGYDFNDDLLEKAPAFWVRLVEKMLPRS
jgi:hippurate hydrolase